MLPKPKRVVDKALLEETRQRPCVVKNSECRGDICAHHIKTRGSGGGDVASNLYPLCVRHHQEIHMIGTYTFRKKYGLD